MILDTITNAHRYANLHPLFAKVFAYIQSTDLYGLTPGKHAIDGDDLFVIIEHVQGRSRESTQLECHRKYIDIQLVLDGVDEMGWKSLTDCQNPVDEYSPAYDVQLFNAMPTAWIATPANSFCIFFPEDAHTALVGTGSIHKAVFKIAVNPETRI
ncbi:YhcH/YjgK/YiaL family protein [Methylotenera mobilis]|uniref:YhcH/YjgK/YiaL family protein n=1 Tax=Methylotenera mobilis (strain JLW8 / ATCC BAA-1282 / DSM 17540) TaxID=583345 RepID=C6WVZ8_METML|nr:YhcH/YjgK/YiaL family protein [Methylotenera mobilis]ACT48097.1 conserved hypothetical protein [Methylotenera mobilis JLW8]